MDGIEMQSYVAQEVATNSVSPLSAPAQEPVPAIIPIAECIGELKWIHFKDPHPVRDFARWDAATRGPWGSLMLIFKHPLNILGVLGATLTIVALAIDPFAQQVMGFQSCLEPVDGALVTIPRANNYTRGDVQYSLGTPSVGGPMTAALYSGLLNPPDNASSLIPTLCPSGNCTFRNDQWGTYTTLAMCASVDDISSSIKGTGSFTSWNYSLPSGLRIMMGEVLATREAYEPPRVFELPSEDTSLFAFQALMVALDCDGNTSTPSELACRTGARAFNVSLSPCLHTYGNVTYTDGIFSETFSLAGNHPSIPGLDCSPSGQPSQQKTQPASLFANRGLYYNNHSAKASDDPETVYFDKACTYDFGYEPTAGLNRILNTVFFGNGTKGGVNRLVTPRGIGHQLVGDVWMERLWANGTADRGSLAAYMDGLTAWITATIRREEAVHDGELAGLGMVYGNQTCIVVSWGWIAFPAALVLLTVVFLALTIFESHRHTTRLGTVAAQAGRKLWKSSALPLLWAGLENDTRYRPDHCFSDVPDMEAYSEKVRVRLSKTVVYVVGPEEGSEPSTGTGSRPLLRIIPKSMSKEHHQIETFGVAHIPRLGLWLEDIASQAGAEIITEYRPHQKESQ
ncbi:Zinc-binding oxidoreductase protein [Apiospora hydei]|uniref:Zinc-binding oxidoreductase protein n=1 Tax=Apiospora hydei TaxID=1337664 RepID=A0ABR1VIX9_9PEZI